MLHCTGPKVQVTLTGTSGAPLTKATQMVVAVFALKCYTRVEVTISDKYPHLLRTELITTVKSFMVKP